MQKAAAAAKGGRIHEVVLPKLFKWYKDDFGFIQTWNLGVEGFSKP